MENKNDQIIRVVIGVIIIIILTIIAVSKPHDLTPPPIYNSCNEDSLRNVITQLRIDNENEEDVELIPVGVNYDKLTSVLVKGIQEQQAIIEQLKARLTALESK